MVVWAAHLAANAGQGSNPERFTGDWSVSMPDASGQFINEPEVTCAQPVKIETDLDQMIRYRTPMGKVIGYEVKVVAGMMIWVPEEGPQMVPDWIASDTFLLLKSDGDDRQNWKTAWRYERCR